MTRKHSQGAVAKLRQKRSRNGCYSCKKLKIKCDEGKPRCEYCDHTDRVCEYPYAPKVSKREGSQESSPEASIMTISSSSSEEDIRSENTAMERLVFPTWTLYGITKFEFGLLNHFERHVSTLFSYDMNPEIDNVWKKFVPSLWQTSKVVRTSVYAFCSLNLWQLSKGASEMGYTESDDTKDATPSLTGVYDEKKIVPSLGDEMMQVVNSKDFLQLNHAYFDRAILENRKLLLVGPSNTDSYKAASELIISGILIFSYLGIHPHNIVPLLSDDENGQDMVSICCALRGAFNISQSIVYNKANFYLHMLGYKRSKDVYNIPLIRKLRKKLKEQILITDEIEYYQINSLHESSSYESFIDLLEMTMAEAIYMNYPIPIFSWITIQGQSFRKYVKQERKYFALKILYIHSCLCLVTGFYQFSGFNLWIDYVKWYRNYNFSLHGEGIWYDDDDALLFNTVVERNVKLDYKEFYKLEYFDFYYEKPI